MTIASLKDTIDRWLGNGIRCLLPSFWWKKILHLIVDYVVDELAKSADKIKEVSEKAVNFDRTFRYAIHDSSIADKEHNISVFNRLLNDRYYVPRKPIFFEFDGVSMVDWYIPNSDDKIYIWNIWQGARSVINSRYYVIDGTTGVCESYSVPSGVMGIYEWSVEGGMVLIHPNEVNVLNIRNTAFNNGIILHKPTNMNIQNIYVAIITPLESIVEFTLETEDEDNPIKWKDGKAVTQLEEGKEYRLVVYGNLASMEIYA